MPRRIKIRSFIAAVAAAVLVLSGIAIAQSDGPAAWDHFSARHDENGDGQVTAEEFGRTDFRFQQLDGDNDGIVTSEELQAGFDRLGERPWPGRFHHRWPRGPEAGFGPRTESGGPPHPAHQHLLRADEDGDGAVTLEEFDAMLDRFDRHAIFDGLDTDGDGIISSEEMSSQRPR